MGFGEDFLKGGTVCGFLEEGKAALPTVQDVIGERSRSKARGAAEEHRSGRSGSVLPPSVCEHGRDTDGIEVLAN